MSRYVGIHADTLSLETVRAAWSVSAEPIAGAQNCANWLLRGTPLVVDGARSFGSSGTKTLSYMYRVDDAHAVVGVALTLSADADSLTVAFFGAGVSVTVTRTPTLFSFALVNGAGTADVNTTVALAWSGAELYVHNVYIYEVPPLSLPNAGGGPIDRGMQIYDGYDNRDSIAGLERSVEELRSTYFRRGTLYNWAIPDEDALETNSASYVGLHVNGILPAIQARAMYAGEVTRTCRVAVKAAGPGSVRVTMTNGDVATMTFPTSALVWQTPADIQVTVDDLAAPGGFTTRDEVLIEYSAPSGPGAGMNFSAISIWDPGGD